MSPFVGSNILAGASGQGSADFKIERSLRFNDDDDANLSFTPSSSGNMKTFTLSFWLKRSTLGNDYHMIYSTNGELGIYFQFNSSNNLDFGDYYGGSYQYRLVTNRVFRDVSAWYHIVIAVDTTQATASDRIKIYVNGVQETSFSTATYPSQNFEGSVNRASIVNKIGEMSTAGNLDGYLAEFHSVDAQQLSPTDLGEYDESNLWQPKEYSGTHGTNGFYLKFADNSSNAALGTDSSGNGNTWTVNNLTADAVTGMPVSAAWTGYAGPTWSSTDTWDSLSDATTNFGNNSGTKGYSSITETWFGTKTDWTGAFGASIRGGNGWALKFSSTITITVNPVATSSIIACASTSTAVSAGTSYTSFPATMTGQVFWFQCTGTPSVGLYGSVGDIPDPSGIDSLIDTPTNYEAGSGNNAGNYATWNPLDYSSGPILSNGNLEASNTGSSHTGRRATFKFPSTGKWYYEATVTTLGGACCLGVANSSSANPGLAQAGTYFILVNSGGSVQKYVGGTATTMSGFSTPAVGSVLQVAYDADAENLWIGMNNVWMGSGTSANGNPSAGSYASASNVSDIFPATSQYTSAIAANFAQRPFVYTPPTGYKSLCTTNLPDSTIADGSTAFDTTLWSGNDTQRDITGLGFSPDMVWIKKRQAGNHSLMDTVRGATKNLVPNDTQREGTEPGYLNAFLSDGFSIGTSGLVNDGSSTYVAWAWDAGTVANPVGDIWQGSATKYIGVKFSSASGGTISFGQTSGSTTVEVWKSSDNSNWTQQGGTLTLSDGHTLTFTDQYVYIRNTSNATFSNWYAAATNGADGHYSSATYPGGAYFTGPAYTDYDWRDSGGTLIHAGGLNSSAYLYGDWTSMVTGNYSSAHGWGTTYQTLNAFDGNLSTMVIPHGSDGWKFEPTTPIAGNKIEIRGWNDGCPNAGLKINGNNYGDALGPDQTVGEWYTLPYSTLESIELAGDGSAGNTEFRLQAIRIDGRLLIQNNQSPPNVPTIASTVRANPSSGFSIVGYTGNAISGTSIGHRLNAAPEFIIIKNKSDTENWFVWHNSFSLPTVNGLYLNLTANAQNFGGTSFNSTLPSSSVITLGNANIVNGSGDNMIAYCFAPIKGYSAFGSYTGNGSTDGPFVFTGFRVAWLMVKRSDGNAPWVIVDTERNTYNVMDNHLLANDSAAENGSTIGNICDSLSNGFKIRGSDGWFNNSGGNYIYATFAEHPFKTARAR